MKPMVVSSAPLKLMRVQGQVGDWFDTGLFQRIIVAEEMGAESCLAVAIHEMIEKFLCDKAGITCEEVDTYDIASEDDDPGLNKKAPYHRQHMKADAVERAVCKAIGISWKKHCRNVYRMFE